MTTTNDGYTFIPFPVQGEVKERFGGCPVCGGADEYFGLGRDYWSVCFAHRTKWPIGSPFTNWRDDEACWDENRAILSGYTKVEPIRYLRDRQYNLPDLRIAADDP